MAKKFLIIKNIETIQLDELKLVLDGLERDNDAPVSFNSLLELEINESNISEAIALFKRKDVLDYLYELTKKTTGNYVIYHFDATSSDDHQNAMCVIEKLKEIPKDMSFDMMYLGGGHGDPTNGSSGFTNIQLESITQELKNNQNKFHSIVLGSCFSASYSGLYQPLLTQEGIMLSHSLECGGLNSFSQTLRWMRGTSNNFYLPDDFNSPAKSNHEERSKLRRLLESISSSQRTLASQYQSIAKEQNPEQINSKILYEKASDLYNSDLDQLIISRWRETNLCNFV